MGFGWRLRVLLLLFFLLVSSSTGVPTSSRTVGVKNRLGSLKSGKDEVLVPRNFRYKGWVKDWGKSGGFLKMEGLIIERRRNIELADYPETGANNDHDPKPPGRV